MDKFANMFNMLAANSAFAKMSFKGIDGDALPALDIEEGEHEEENAPKNASDSLAISVFGGAEEVEEDGFALAEGEEAEGYADVSDAEDDSQEISEQEEAEFDEAEVDEDYAGEEEIAENEELDLEELKDAEDEADAAQLKADDDSKALADADIDVENAQAKAEAAQAEIDEIEAESELEGNEAVTEEKLNDLNDDLKELEEEQAQKQREKEELEAEKKRLEAELEAAKAAGDKEKIAELEGELANVNGRLDSVNGDLNNLNENIQNTRDSIDTTSKELADQKAAKQQAAQDKLDAAQNRLNDANKEAEEAAAAQADAADSAAKSQDTAEQAQSKAQSIDQKAQSARQEADQKAQAAAQADAELASAEAALAEAQTPGKDEEGNPIPPDEGAVAAAQAEVDRAQAAADKAHAEADSAEANAADLERQAQQAQGKADQADTQASSENAKAEDSAAAADKADQNVGAAQNAVDNAQNQVNQANAGNNAAQGNNNGGGNNGGGGGNNGGGGGGTRAAGGGGGTRAAGGGGTKTNQTGGNNAVDTGVKGSTNATGESVLDDDLDFSGCSPAAVASAVEQYAASKGYDVPEGFGAELVKVCDKNNIDYGMALAACEANGFGSDGKGLMGFGAADSAGETEGANPDAWKSELGDGVAKLADLREKGGAKADDPVKYQLDKIASQSGDTEWAKNVYGKYSEGVSPELAKIDGVKSDYLSYIEGVMGRCNACKGHVLDGKETLYDVIMKKDGCTLDEAKAKVRARIDGVLERYAGADAACMSGLTMIDIASEYGVRLNYGAAKTPSHLAKDIDPAVVSDCRNFVSWCLDHGHEDYLYSMNVGQLGLGYSENGVHDRHTSNYADMKPGDIMTKGAVHAMMPVYVDPVSKTIILVESSGDKTGVQVRQLSFKKAAELGYTFVSGDSIYNGSADSYNYGRSHGY